jgi:hypothetical protein
MALLVGRVVWLCYKYIGELYIGAYIVFADKIESEVFIIIYIQ